MCGILSNLITIGETAGIPQDVLRDISFFREKKLELKRKHQENKMATTDKRPRILKGDEILDILTDVDKIEGKALAFFPCAFCLKPCKTLSSLDTHLLQAHHARMMDFKEAEEEEEEDVDQEESD